ERREQVGVLARDGQDHDLGTRKPGRDLPGGREAATGHADVEQAYIGSLANGRLHGARGIRHLGAHFEARIGVEGLTYVGPGRGVVVRDQDADDPRCHAHIMASTWQPTPGSELMLSSPPTERARSRIEVSP